MAKKTSKKSSAKPKAKAASKKATKRAPSSAGSGSSPEQMQEDAYAQGVELFNKGKFAQALKRLEEVAEGPEPGLRHRAGVYVTICKQRTERDTPQLKSTEDHYNYAVTLINDRELDDAETHLQKALKGNKDGGHIYYALAVVASLRDDADAAYENLALAIQKDPRHRIQAKVDSDLTPVVGDPRVVDLLTADEDASTAGS